MALLGSGLMNAIVHCTKSWLVRQYQQLSNIVQVGPCFKAIVASPCKRLATCTFTIFKQSRLLH